MWDLIVSVADHCLSFYFLHVGFLNAVFPKDLFKLLVHIACTCNNKSK